VRPIRILASRELARVHREDTVSVPDDVGRFTEEVHPVRDDQSNDEGADVDVADPLRISISIGVCNLVVDVDLLACHDMEQCRDEPSLMGMSIVSRGRIWLMRLP
jgi:hypothetical protein